MFIYEHWLTTCLLYACGKMYSDIYAACMAAYIIPILPCKKICMRFISISVPLSWIEVMYRRASDRVKRPPPPPITYKFAYTHIIIESSYSTPNSRSWLTSLDRRHAGAGQSEHLPYNNIYILKSPKSNQYMYQLFTTKELLSIENWASYCIAPAARSCVSVHVYVLRDSVHVCLSA